MADRIDLHNLLRDRVNRGTALLDERRPEWFKNVDTAHLSLSDSCRCVLGQIGAAAGITFGQYTMMLDVLGLYDSDDAILYGFDFTATDEDPGWLLDRFDADEEGEDNVTGEGFGILDELWIEAIHERS